MRKTRETEEAEVKQEPKKAIRRIAIPVWWEKGEVGSKIPQEKLAEIHATVERVGYEIEFTEPRMVFMANDYREMKDRIYALRDLMPSMLKNRFFEVRFVDDMFKINGNF
mgnify:CR=1 FL=1